MSCLTERDTRLTLMIGIPKAGVLSDHGSAADLDASHGDQVNATRKNSFVADLDTGSVLCFQVKVGVKQHILTEADPLCAVDQTSSQHHD